MSDFVIAFTGHRPAKFGGARWVVTDRLKRRLRALRGDYQEPRRRILCVSGMAVGFDQWAAQACVDLGIPFDACVPFAGQESRWPHSDREVYRRLLAKARAIETVSKRAPTRGTSIAAVAKMMQDRNERMVDRADLVLAAWNGTVGGTANCLAYAREKNKAVENLWPGAAPPEESGI